MENWFSRDICLGVGTSIFERCSHLFPDVLGIEQMSLLAKPVSSFVLQVCKASQFHALVVTISHWIVGTGSSGLVLMVASAALWEQRFGAL